MVKRINFWITENLLHILSLLNRNEASTTVGCFDKNYWYFKKNAFPNGMRQNYTFSLALTHQLLFNLNRIFCNEEEKILQKNLSQIIPLEELQRYIYYSIRYTANIISNKGTLDEHYRNENSIVAIAFNIISIFESMEYLRCINNPQVNESIKELEKEIKPKIELALQWLMNNQESVIISNHQASVIFALIYGYKKYQEIKYIKKASEYLQLLLKNQSKEGWFIEYDGCDIGYLTLTQLFLGKIFQCLRSFDEQNNNPEVMIIVKDLKQSIEESILKLIHFFSDMFDNNGIYGGTVWSRNTFHFFLSGFNLIINLNIIQNEREKKIYLKYISNYISNFENYIVETINDDEFLFFHYNDIIESLHFYNWLKDEHKLLKNSVNNTISDLIGCYILPEAGILKIIKNDGTFIASFRKGANYQWILNMNKQNQNQNSQPVFSSGYIITLKNHKKYQTSELINVQIKIFLDDHPTEIQYFNPDKINEKISQKIRIEMIGIPVLYKEELLTPYRQILLDGASSTLLKNTQLNQKIKAHLIQKNIIQNKKKSIGLFFKRNIEFIFNNEIIIKDELLVSNKTYNQIQKIEHSFNISSRFIPSSQYYLSSQIGTLQLIPQEKIKKEQQRDKIHLIFTQNIF